MGMLDFLPRVDSCCGSVPLKPATIIAGIVSILIANIQYEYYDAQSLASKLGFSLRPIDIAMMSLMIIMTIASVVLIIAAFIDNGLMMLIWIFVAILFVIAGLIIAIIALTEYAPYLPFRMYWTKVLFILGLFLIVYFIFVVNSHMQDVE